MKSIKNYMKSTIHREVSGFMIIIQLFKSYIKHKENYMK